MPPPRNAKASPKKEKKKRKMQKEEPRKTSKKRKTTKFTTVSSAIRDNRPKRVRGHCDICLNIDLSKGCILQTCQECGVQVHNRCYGRTVARMNHGVQQMDWDVPELQRDPKFTCHACSAIGTSVATNERDPKTGQRIVIDVTRRPTSCCLCSVSIGNHAMHPLYDHHGRYGHHILLPAQCTPNEPRKLAWAHTLCAQAININPSTRGTIYGCLSNGYYGPDDNGEELGETESVNPDLDVDPTDSFIHHFVYWGYRQRQLGQRPDQWTRAIQKQRTEMSHCMLCGKHDNETTVNHLGNTVPATLRIPLQCCANNDDEKLEFKTCHKASVPPGETCYQSLHVGCAMWHSNDQRQQSLARRVWYHAGNNACPEPCAHLYCDLHADDLLQHGVKGSNMKSGFPEQSRLSPIPRSPPKQKRASQQQQVIVRRTAITSPVAKKGKTAGQQQLLARKSSATRIEPGVSLRRNSVTATTNPSGKAEKVIRRSSAAAAADPLLAAVSRGRRLTNKQKYLNAAMAQATEAVPLHARKSGPLARKAKTRTRSGKIFASEGANAGDDDAGDEDQESNSTNSHLVQQIIDDLFEVGSHQIDGVVTKEIQNQRKMFWMRASGLPDDAFLHLWKSAIKLFKEIHTSSDSPSSASSKPQAVAGSGAEGGNTDVMAPAFHSENGSAGTSDSIDQANDDDDVGGGGDGDGNDGQPDGNSTIPRKRASALESHASKRLSENRSRLPTASKEDANLAAIVQTITNDLVSMVEILNEDARATEVGPIIRERRVYWKSTLSLRKVQFKMVFGEAVENLATQCHLDITTKTLKKDKESDAGSTMTAEASNTASTDANESRSVVAERAGMGEEGNSRLSHAEVRSNTAPDSAVPVDEAVNNDAPASSSVIGWEYLYPGSQHFDRAGFKFSSWESVTKIGW